jgi:hypothetical protein
MKRTAQDYTRIATKEFLEGTRFKTPVQAVEAGERSIEQWCDCVNAHRRKDSNQTDSNQTDSNQFGWQDNNNPAARPANT